MDISGVPLEHLGPLLLLSALFITALLAGLVGRLISDLAEEKLPESVRHWACGLMPHPKKPGLSVPNPLLDEHFLQESFFCELLSCEMCRCGWASLFLCGALMTAVPIPLGWWLVVWPVAWRIALALR